MFWLAGQPDPGRLTFRDGPNQSNSGRNTGRVSLRYPDRLVRVNHWCQAVVDRGRCLPASSIIQNPQLSARSVHLHVFSRDLRSPARLVGCLDRERVWVMTIATKLRAAMPVVAHWAYLDHAAVAPLSRPAFQAIGDWSASAAEQGDTVWPEWARRVESIRATAAAMINALPSEIALVPNTTAGINLVAQGYPWKAGDNVVTLEDEFPSNLYPWMQLQSQGVQTRRVPVHAGRPDLNRLAEACDERTRIVSASWVGYASGWRIDVRQVADLAHQAGALFFLDAIQGMGVFPLDVAQAGVDFLAADGHKWMLGPEGAGIFYIRQEHLDRLRPTSVGWNSVVGRYAFDKTDLQLRDSAARFEGGSANMVGLHALGASLDLLVGLGVTPERSEVAQAVVSISDQACAMLQASGARLMTQREPGHKSGIVVFEIPGHAPDAVRAHCAQSKVVLSARGSGVRISPHAYNNRSDLEQLIHAIESMQ